jgi:flagellar biosynthesis/type III secretory pathway protein FliH
MLSERSRGRVIRSGASRAAFQPGARTPVFSQEDVDDAYARGFLAGTEDAEADMRRACISIAEGVAGARDTVVAEVRRIDAARRDEIVEFAFEVARWLVQAEIETDPRRVLDRLHAALPDRLDDVTARVAPTLVEVVRRAVPEVQIAGDASLGLGDIRIIGPDSNVDATIDDALERLRAYLATDDDGALR